jgi:hypothetical protein
MWQRHYARTVWREGKEWAWHNTYWPDPCPLPKLGIRAKIGRIIDRLID